MVFVKETVSSDGWSVTYRERWVDDAILKPPTVNKTNIDYCLKQLDKIQELLTTQSKEKEK